MSAGLLPRRQLDALLDCSRFSACLTVYFDDGTSPVGCGSTGAGRVTVRINDCPGTAGKRFVGVVVNGTSQTVVERATYYSAGGLFASGGAAWATPIP